MPTLIHDRVQLAREGRNPYVIARLPSGWLVIGDVQLLLGYCLLLADPVAESLNALDEAGRVAYGCDVARIGDALLAATDAYRVNYETLGNSEPALHTHITPRYLSEPEDKRRRPAMMSYDWSAAPPFDPARDGPFMQRMREALIALGAL